MAFLDKLGSLAKNFGDKTNEAIAMSKLNGKITSEKALAETELRKIGEYYYGQFLSGGQIEPEILEACQSAKAHYDEAAHAQLEIDRIRAAEAAQAVTTASAGPVCPSCGTENTAGTKFCRQCGTKLVAEPPAVCPQCGAAAEPGVKFCPECGTALSQPEQAPRPDEQ